MPAPVMVFLAWCILVPAACGTGFCLGRMLPRPADPIGVPLAFWLGISAMAGLLAAWHLFLPVDGRAWALLGPLAAAGLWAALREGLAGVLWKRRARIAILAAVAFSLAVPAALPATCADDGLYFTQTIRWNSLYPAVPGLGNLHPFLALNNGYHLLVAAFGVGPLSLRGEHVANGLLLLGVLGACTGGLVRLVDPRGGATWADALAALLLGPALDSIGNGFLACPMADCAVYMMGTGLLVPALSPALRGARMEAGRFAALVIVAAGAIILKQSLLCVALPALAFAAAHWIRSARPGKAELLRMLRFAAVAGAAFALPWMAHGLVLSGYPVYPSAWPDLGIPWRMDRGVVIDIYRWVQAFARWPGHSYAEVAASSAWVGRWFAREWLNNRTFLLPLASAAAGAATLAVAVASGRRPSRPAAAALAAAVGGLAIWWLLAPDTRFAGPLLWAGGGLSLIAAASAFRERPLGALRGAMAAGAVALAAGAFLPPPGLLGWRSDFPPLRRNLDNPKARLADGEPIDVSGKDGCWDPPCGFPPIDPRLRLRTPGCLRCGFTLAPLPPPAPAPAPAPR